MKEKEIRNIKQHFNKIYPYLNGNYLNNILFKYKNINEFLLKILKERAKILFPEYTFTIKDFSKTIEKDIDREVLKSLFNKIILILNKGKDYWLESENILEWLKTLTPKESSALIINILLYDYFYNK